MVAGQFCLQGNMKNLSSRQHEEHCYSFFLLTLLVSIPLWSPGTFNVNFRKRWKHKKSQFWCIDRFRAILLRFWKTDFFDILLILLENVWKSAKIYKKYVVDTNARPERDFQVENSQNGTVILDFRSTRTHFITCLTFFFPVTVFLCSGTNAH